MTPEELVEIEMPAGELVELSVEEPAEILEEEQPEWGMIRVWDDQIGGVRWTDPNAPTEPKPAQIVSTLSSFAEG